MNEEHPGRAHIDPRLLNLMDETDGLSWLFVDKLKKGDVLEIQTLNTLYTMKVVNPFEGEVLVNSNGKTITEETPAYIWGTTLTGNGNMIKLGKIAVGLRLVIFEGRGQITLSATQEVRVNGEKVLPKSVNPTREP